MASLLLVAFPVPGIAMRRTRDADTASTTELAGSGVLHDRLIARWWATTAGNHYIRTMPELGVPSRSAPGLPYWQTASLLLLTSPAAQAARALPRLRVRPLGRNVSGNAVVLDQAGHQAAGGVEVGAEVG